MRKTFSKLAWTYKAAAFAGLLGVGALFLGNPYQGELLTINLQDLALIVQNEQDHISVHELADWIIQGKADYRLLDVRSGDEFNKYHIPSAENIQLTDLLKADYRRNEKIIVYSEGGIHAAQAWMILASRGFKQSYILLGGLEEWKNKILYPHLPENPDPSQIDSLSKIRSISSHFGGSVQSGTMQNEVVSVPTPKLNLPSGLPSAAKPAVAKKKKEGC